ncbi:MAG: MFS transporter [Clostridiales bacterium]|nr:MFS transporter [Clostridiales bacterium]
MRGLWPVLVAVSLASFADRLLIFVLSLLVYEETRSVPALGLVLLLQALPVLLSGMLAALFAPVGNSRWLLPVLYTGQGLLAAVLFLWPAPSTVYPFTFLQSLAARVAALVVLAWLPEWVGRDRLVAANAWLAAAMRTMQIVAPGLAGALLVAAGMRYGLAASALAFLLAGLTIACGWPEGGGRATGLFAGHPVSQATAGRQATPPATTTGGTSWTDLALLLACSLLYGGAIGIHNVLFIPVVQDEMGYGPGMIGILMTAMGLGMAAGAAAMGAWARRLPVILLPGSLAALAAWLWLFSEARSPGPALFVRFAMGVAHAGFGLVMVVSLQRMTETVGGRGRLLAIQKVAEDGGLLAGLALGSVVAPVLGLVPTFRLAAAPALLAVLVAVAWGARVRAPAPSGL